MGFWRIQRYFKTSFRSPLRRRSKSLGRIIHDHFPKTFISHICISHEINILSYMISIYHILSVSYIRSYIPYHSYIWVNYNNSLTWILRPFGADFPYKNHDSSEGEQWGRYNLPRYIRYIISLQKNGAWWRLRLPMRITSIALDARMEAAFHGFPIGFHKWGIPKMDGLFQGKTY